MLDVSHCKTGDVVHLISSSPLQRRKTTVSRVESSRRANSMVQATYTVTALTLVLLVSISIIHRANTKADDTGQHAQNRGLVVGRMKDHLGRNKKPKK